MQKPLEGIREKSALRVAKGVVQGVLGLALSPVIGALGIFVVIVDGLNYFNMQQAQQQN